MIAKNAEKIIAARLKGRRPADMVLVCLEDALKTNNPVVYAKPRIAYDWRWVRGLDIALYVNDADDWGSLAKDIAMHHPAYLCIWNNESKWGARIYLIPTDEDILRPMHQWKCDIDFTVWMDFQNKDFIECRVYARDENGTPYAVN